MDYICKRTEWTEPRGTNVMDILPMGRCVIAFPMITRDINKLLARKETRIDVC